jgi:cytochrome P450
MLLKSAPGPSDRELLTKIGAIQNDPLSFLVDLAQQYGGVASFHVFRLPVIVLSSAEGVKHVLQDQNASYSKNTIQYNALKSITGKGLLTNDGEDWLRQRRLAQPAFARPRVLALDQIVVPAVQAMLERWAPSLRAQTALDIDREMMQLTLEIVGKALFSIDLSGEAHALTGAVLTTLDHIVYRARNMVTHPAFLPTPRNLRFHRALATLDRAVYNMIAQRQQASDPGSDLLGMLLAARDPETGQAMSNHQVRDELMTMLVAGHETVASALTWTWLLLAQNPAARAQMDAEIEQVLQNRPPSAADLAALPYTAAVFSEALRLYPPAWLITRQALAEDSVEGWRIPKGALVILSPYTVHRQANTWPDSEAFKPERFLEKEPPGAPGLKRFAYIPFGAGPRICIGNQFAQVEGQLILATVAQRCHLELTAPQPRTDALVTLRPHGGLPMRVKPR